MAGSTDGKIARVRLFLNFLSSLCFWKSKPHIADEYFKYKFREPMSSEARNIVFDAHSIRHKYPELSGPELVRLVYWGASGVKPDGEAA